MAKGENIFHRKDGRWEARYIKGYELSGKIKYGFCYGKTYREAKEKVTKYKAALVNGKAVPTNTAKHRFAYYCNEWLRLKKGKIRESTYIKYSTVLHSVLKYTATLFPGVFPVIEINYPKESRKEMRVLSRDEQNRFMSYLLTDMDSCKFGLLLALSTGVRIGELCALQWCNINIREQTIKIAATLQRLHDTDMQGEARTRIVIGAPKSDTSARTIPMISYLADLCKQMDPGNMGAYVLTGTTDYMEPRTLQYRIEKYTRACGLEGIHAHTLRHTFATRAVEVGFEIKSLSEVLGHSTTTITLERYVHSSMELKRSNMNKLNVVGL